MRIIKFMCIVSLFTAAIVESAAQSVDDICLKNIEALGGKVAVNNVKSLKITQVGTSHGSNMPIVTILVPGKIYYQKVRTSIGGMVSCVNGNDAWTHTTAPTPKTTTIPWAKAKSMLIDSKFYGPLYDYYVNGEESDVKIISIDGHSTINREDCYKLTVTYKSGYKTTVFVSKLDNMIKKAESSSGIVRYNNYKKVNGVMIPRYVEITNALGTVTAVVSKVNINSKINNDMFSRP